jgi:hypothetical protein
MANTKTSNSTNRTNLGIRRSNAELGIKSKTKPIGVGSGGVSQDSIRDTARRSLLNQIDTAELSSKMSENARALLNMPRDLPELSGLSARDVNTFIGHIESHAGLLSMNDPILRAIGGIGIAYAIKPGLVRGILSSSVGQGAISGLSGGAVGNVVGSMLYRSPIAGVGISGIAGYGAGAALTSFAAGGPIGGLAASIFAGFAGHSRRRAIRRIEEQKRQAAAQITRNMDLLAEDKVQISSGIDRFIESANIASQSLLSGREYVEQQRRHAQELRDTNISLISSNIEQINRVGDLRSMEAQRQLKKILGAQRVAFAARGLSQAGSGWFLEGEIQSMGIRSEQEIRNVQEVKLKEELISYRNVLSDYAAIDDRLNYSAQQIELQGRELKNEIEHQKGMYESNMRRIDISFDEQKAQLSDLGYSYEEGKLTRFRRTNSQRAMDNARALALISYGEQTRSMGEIQNPFSTLLAFRSMGS